MSVNGSTWHVGQKFNYQFIGQIFTIDDVLMEIIKASNNKTSKMGTETIKQKTLGSVCLDNALLLSFFFPLL